jgi:hypothetical protein
MGTPISGLPAEGTVLTTDIVPLVSGGVTKIATIAEIGTAIGGGGGGAGVDSLAGLTGALTLESTDSTIAITPTGTSIDLTVVGGGGVPSEYDSMILSEPGLMYYYPLSDTTTPICLATGRGSIVNGSPTYSATSLIASGDPAITFPTDSDSLGFDRAFATFANTPFSWECFIELPSLPSSNLKFISMENSGTGTGSALYITTGGRLMAEFYDESDSDGGFNFTAGTPYHVALVFDGGSLTTWVNGVANYIGIGRPLDVGGGGGNPFISGGSITIQKVAFYSVMLTKRRILAHYAQIAANTPSYPLIP